MSDADVVSRFVARRVEQRRARVVERRSKMVEALPALTSLLVRRGARTVWLFGSLAWGEAHEGSDIDLAVEGLPGDDLLRAQGELLIASPCGVDLVRVEEAPASLVDRIRREGRKLHG